MIIAAPAQRGFLPELSGQVEAVLLRHVRVGDDQRQRRARIRRGPRKGESGGWRRPPLSHRMPQLASVSFENQQIGGVIVHV